MNLPTHIEGFCFDGKNWIKTQKKLRLLQDDEVLIQNATIGLNPVDWKVIKQNNIIAGVDGAGIAIATNNPNINIGSRYAYHCDLKTDGSFANYTIVKAKALIPIDNHVNDILAASLPCTGLTAIQSIDKLPLVKNKNILIYGCGSMVGKILASLLINKGAKVYVSASNIHHQELYNIGVIKCYEYAENIDIKNLYAIFDTTAKAQHLIEKISYYGHMISILNRIDKNPLEKFSTCVSFHEVALGAIHSYGNDGDFANLIKKGIKLYKKVINNEILLPKIELINFDQIPTKLKELQNGIKGVKFVAKA
ncbi:alcohol dehydrogenase [Campylobacter lari]|nr:alcohol dehydrogenase [Campylobacter lari]